MPTAMLGPGLPYWSWSWGTSLKPASAGSWPFPLSLTLSSSGKWGSHVLLCSAAGQRTTWPTWGWPLWLQLCGSPTPPHPTPWWRGAPALLSDQQLELCSYQLLLAALGSGISGQFDRLFLAQLSKVYLSVGQLPVK